MKRWLSENWRKLIQDVLVALGAIFLLIESYEVVSDTNIQLSFTFFLIIVILAGGIHFLLDGYYWTGFLKNEVELPHQGFDTKIRVKVGDLFEEKGWKAIGVNDFFDHVVDEDLVSSRSLHGQVILRYWRENPDDWLDQVKDSLSHIEPAQENRRKGNKNRYPIGATACARASDQKFLLVALSHTNPQDNVTTANLETFICAVGGLLVRARAACSLEPLIIPLMGTGLARVGLKHSVMLDIIIAAILEESRKGRITEEIIVVVPRDRKGQINLKNHVRNWKNGI
ncbi:MAG: macro domain-containing protein [Pseudomonadota bacterium]